MDEFMKELMSYGFIIFGLGFFLFVMHTIKKDDRDFYDRKLNEAREFGFEGSKLQNEAQNSKKKR